MEVTFKEKLDEQRSFILDAEKAKTAGETSITGYSDGFVTLRGEKIYDLSESLIEVGSSEFERVLNWAVKFDLIVQ